MTNTPTRYCRKCWYVLDGLSKNRCPECGRAFDPNNPKSYRDLPRRKWWLKYTGRTALIAFVALLIGVAFPSISLYRMYHHEKDAMTLAIKLGGGTDNDPYAPAWLGGWVEFDRITYVQVSGSGITESQFASFGGLKKLQEFALRNTPVTNDYLIHLQAMPQLQGLYLAGTEVTDEGLKHVAELKQLQFLDLDDTDVSDKGITILQGLSELKQIKLRGTKVTQQGIDSLRSALPEIDIVLE